MVSKKQLFAQQTDLLAKHDLAMDNLDDYGEFLETWLELTNINDREVSPNQHNFVDFESYASFAVNSFVDTGHDLSNDQLGQHECAAALVAKNGLIKQINTHARLTENLHPGRSLSSCGIQFEGEDNIDKLFQNKEKDGLSTFHLVQVVRFQSNTLINLAISKVNAPDQTEPLFLVLFVVPPDVQVTVTLMANKFNFTSIETEIAKAFLGGVALRDIAEQRGRSYPTIRNQFQRILEKSGCTSQTDLFRLSFSLLLLMGNLSKPEKGLSVNNQNVNRTMTLPRPNGRMVELVLSGDKTGQPVLNLHSLFGHGITAKIEENLRDQSILLISPMRPGFGGTSVAGKGQNLYDCVAGDVRAILDSLEIQHCSCIGRASAARTFYNLLARLPDRINRGVLVNGMIPKEYIESKNIKSRWTTALMSASYISYPIARLILETGSSLLLRSNSVSFLKKMYQNSISDYASFDDEEVIFSIQTGVHQMKQQGLDASAQEMVEAFQNWSNELQDLQTPISLYHGHLDPNVPIKAVRKFAEDNAHCLTLVEEAEGGGLLSYSHTDKMINLAVN